MWGVSGNCPQAPVTTIQSYALAAATRQMMLVTNPKYARIGVYSCVTSRQCQVQVI